MKSITLLFVISATALAVPVFASPKEKGHGNAGHGRMSDDFRGVIHALFEKNEEVDRAVEMTDKGYRATTTSKTPEVAEMIQKHVSQMKSRLEGGAGVRNWDPAFSEFRDYYDEMAIEVKEVERGVSVEVKGKTPEAIKVAQNHAKIVSGFVEKGSEQMHATHSPALTPDSEATAVAGANSTAAAKCEACGKEACGPSCKGCGKGKKPCCSDKKVESN